MKTVASFRDIVIGKEGKTLILANSRIRRVLDLSQGAPKTVSLQTASGRELAAAGNPSFDLAFICLHGPGEEETPWRVTGIKCEQKRRDLYEPERLIVTISMEEPEERCYYEKRYILYPDMPLIGCECAIRTAVMPNLYWSHRRAIPEYDINESVCDALALAKGVEPRMSVEFRGRTDVEPVPVIEHTEISETMSGNLLYCDDGAGHGLFFLQETPPSRERRDWEKHDFHFVPGSRVIRSCTWGVAPEDIHSERTTYRSNRHVLFVHDSDEEKAPILKRYLAARYDQSAFHAITVNPWGCGCFPKLVNPDFLKAECKAAAEVGATSYQFDDGWQQMRGLQQLTRWNKYMTTEFWQLRDNIKKEFPAIIKECKKSGVRPALWFAPPFNSEYRNWRKAAEILLNMHEKYGISCFKVDAVMIRTYEAEKNLRSMMDFLRRKSGGKIYFNLDTTNGQRPGYFLFLEFGNIFLENRYLFYGGNIFYHPERSLRALWQLSKYTRAQSLQIEVPYPGDYTGKCLADGKVLDMSDPCLYSLEYWCATSLFANPLLWFTPSRVPAKTRAVYKKMMDLHEKIRERLFAGEIYPLGEEPDGTRLTGFRSTSGYVLFFRELNAEKSEAFFPELKEGKWKILAGNGTLTDGKLKMPQKGSYLLAERADA